MRNVKYKQPNVKQNSWFGRYVVQRSVIDIQFCRESVMIPKGKSESVYRRRIDNTMAKGKGTKGQPTINKAYI